MRAAVGIALFLVIGCGRLGYDVQPGSSGIDGTAQPAELDAGVEGGEMDAALDAESPVVDAGVIDERRTDGSSVGDAGVADAGSSVVDAGAIAPSPCPALNGRPWELGAPEALTVLNTSRYEGGISITSDGLTLYFSSTRDSNDRDIFRSDRATTSAAWSAPVRVAESFNTSADDSHFAVHADGRTAVLARTSTSSDVFLATRSSRHVPWGPFAPIPSLATAEQEWDPWLSSDGLRIVLTVTNLPGGMGGSDLAVATRGTLSAPFGAPVPLSVSTAGHEAAPTLSEDELFIVFVRENAAGGDLYYATRPDRASPFGPTAPLVPANTGVHEGEPALAPAACELYFARDVAGALDLFRARFVAR